MTEQAPQVIADAIRFKIKLGIGEDAVASLRVSKRLQEIWDVGGVAATGGGVAASPLVAGTFFSGWLSALGLTTAVTPLGWVLGAAALSGGAYWGVMRLLRAQMGAQVQVIPKAINTPVDLLGAMLFDLLGALALKLQPDAARIEAQFARDWGYDPRYLAQSLPALARETQTLSPSEIAQAFARFARQSPDCNFAAMSAEILQELQALGAEEGRLTPAQWLVWGEIEQVFAREGRLWRRLGARLWHRLPKGRSK